MLKSTVERLKRNFITYMLIFIIGNTVGGMGAYAAIGKDCSVMRMFRIMDVAYSCQRLAP